MTLFTAADTDLYQLRMAQAYYLEGSHRDQAVFDYFFRKIPFKNGYAVFCGLQPLLEVVENLRFREQDISFLGKQGFDPRFLEYLQHFQFRGDIDSVAEGEIIFANTPLLRINAGIAEALILETLLLNMLNYQTLIATKASRIRLAAGTRTLIDFGLRRAHGPAGYYASRAAIIGGFDATSHVHAGCDFNLPVAGTCSHAFIQSFDTELEAFRIFTRHWPENSILLVDTYDTLQSGLPNAIQVAREMAARGRQLKGIRLDSGDLAGLATQARRMLDRNGLNHVRITASNQIDEHIITSLINQQAPIDTYGVGTQLAIGAPDAALDGVYKLSMYKNHPRLKISESLSKTTLPGVKQVYRLFDDHDNFAGADVIALADEPLPTTMFHPDEADKSLELPPASLQPLLAPVMRHGNQISAATHVSDIASYHQQRLACLPAEYRRFDNPHRYQTGLGYHLKQQRNQLVSYYGVNKQ